MDGRIIQDQDCLIQRTSRLKCTTKI